MIKTIEKSLEEILDETTTQKKDLQQIVNVNGEALYNRVQSLLSIIKNYNNLNEK